MRAQGSLASNANATTTPDTDQHDWHWVKERMEECESDTICMYAAPAGGGVLALLLCCCCYCCCCTKSGGAKARYEDEMANLEQQLHMSQAALRDSRSKNQANMQELDGLRGAGGAGEGRRQTQGQKKETGFGKNATRTYRDEVFDTTGTGKIIGVVMNRVEHLKEGLLVKSVKPDGLAHGKVFPNDIVVQLNGTDMATADMAVVKRILTTNDKIAFKLMRVTVQKQAGGGGGSTKSKGKKATGSMKSTKSTASTKTMLNQPPGSGQRAVTLDRAGGKKLGAVFVKNPATGRGVVVKSVDPGQQAAGKLSANDVITHINGMNVTKSTMEEVKWLISKDTLVKFAVADAGADEYLVMAESDEETAAVVGALATVAGSVGGTRPVTLNKDGQPHIGFSLMKNPSTGKGPAVKTVTTGGIAMGKLAPGDIIISANGTNVETAKLKTVRAIFEQRDLIELIVRPCPVQLAEATVRLLPAARHPGTAE